MTRAVEANYKRVVPWENDMNFSRPLSAVALLAATLFAQDMAPVSGLVVDATDRSPLAEFP